MQNVQEVQRYVKIQKLARIRPPKDAIALLECKDMGRVTGGALQGYFVWDFHKICSLPDQDLDYYMRLVAAR